MPPVVPLLLSLAVSVVLAIGSGPSCKESDTAPPVPTTPPNPTTPPAPTKPTDWALGFACDGDSYTALQVSYARNRIGGSLADLLVVDIDGFTQGEESFTVLPVTDLATGDVPQSGALATERFAAVSAADRSVVYAKHTEGEYLVREFSYLENGSYAFSGSGVLSHLVHETDCTEMLGMLDFACTAANTGAQIGYLTNRGHGFMGDIVRIEREGAAPGQEIILQALPIYAAIGDTFARQLHIVGMNGQGDVVEVSDAVTSLRIAMHRSVGGTYRVVPEDLPVVTVPKSTCVVDSP